MKCQQIQSGVEINSVTRWNENENLLDQKSLRILSALMTIWDGQLES